MKLLRINEKDNVAVALNDIVAGEKLTIGKQDIIAREKIPQGHKIALYSIACDAEIVKYGYVIGRAKADIEPGAWVHSHNLKTDLNGKTMAASGQCSAALPQKQAARFQGYYRADGRVGTRNEIWILPTVGCINSVARALARSVEAYALGKTDGVFAWPHPYGCSQLGDDECATQKILCDLIRHPNAGGVLVVGLGCENSNISVLQEMLGSWDTERVAFLECRSSPDEWQEGNELLCKLIDRASHCVRQEADVTQLTVGLKCGGSDGLSGITANPLLGRVSDELIAMGGTAILGEIPEMFGAEQVMCSRCANKKAAQALPTLLQEFRAYYLKNGQSISENPSPGNKAGGITTLEEKSLGCVQKGGKAPVVGVFRYGDPAQTHGLCVLQTPGNDLISATAMAAAGAQLILFTTGRGTPFGTVVPTIKISTNTALQQQKGRWIDFNAGTLVSNGQWGEMTASLLQLVLDTASGHRTKSEENDCRDIAIWKNGVTL